MNTHAKGNRNKNKTKEYLQNQGYIVADVEKSGRFIKEKDAFGFCDLIAICPLDTIFCQVKSNGVKINDARDIASALPKPPGIKWLVFNWKDRVRDPVIINVT